MKISFALMVEHLIHRFLTNDTQRYAKRRAPGCVNVLVKVLQSLEATAGTKFTRPGVLLLSERCMMVRPETARVSSSSCLWLGSANSRDCFTYPGFPVPVQLFHTSFDLPCEYSIAWVRSCRAVCACRLRSGRSSIGRRPP